MMQQQLPLSILLPEKVTLDNFIIGDNQALIQFMSDFCAGKTPERHLYIWGQSGAGRTHLLQAATHLTHEHASYIPLLQCRELDPALLQNMQELSLICFDDVQSIAKHDAWEHALFYLYQQVIESKTRIIWSADVPPAHLALRLADLRSRLAASLIFHLSSLNDADKILALQQHASLRGLALPDNVGQYLIAHYSRKMNDLVEILNQLDHAALVAQRALTIPFIKQVLD